MPLPKWPRALEGESYAIGHDVQVYRHPTHYAHANHPQPRLRRDYEPRGVRRHQPSPDPRRRRDPGNSGGALINPYGELIGINTAIYSDSGLSQGIGFAIPATPAHRVMQEIVDHGYVALTVAQRPAEG